MIRDFLFFEKLIECKNPKDTVTNPIIGINGKNERLSNEPKLKILFGLCENKLKR